MYIQIYTSIKLDALGFGTICKISEKSGTGYILVLLSQSLNNMFYLSHTSGMI